MKVMLSGPGAFGIKHLDGIKNIDGVEVVSLVGRELGTTQKVANEYGIGHVSTNLEQALAETEAEAVILCTPTQQHASESIQCMKAGKHVLVEIPMADNLADSREVVKVQREIGVVAMAGHVRRFNPSHQWIHNRIKAGEINIQQLDVQTYFFRRTNMNALGKPRTWTDHLLWHHACHTIDLFQYQTGETPSQVYGLHGPMHPELGIAMDMSIGMKTPSGSVCTLSLSFNNDGPLGTFFRYICDNGTYVARYDDLYDGYDKPIDLSGVAVSSNGIELIDREFVSAIAEGREPNGSVAQCLPAMETMDRIERTMTE